MRIVMMGTGTFAEPTFEALLKEFPVAGLVTQPEHENLTKRGSTRQTGQGMASIARAAGIAVAQPESINQPTGLAELRAFSPDLLVVAAYGQILSKEVLAVPALGTINVHASLLPKYRGAAPVAYAILKGESQAGVTIIKVTPGLDSGAMLLQEAIDILPNDTTGSLEARLAELGAKMALAVVHRYHNGEVIEGIAQDLTLVTKAPKIKKEHGLIDWSQSAIEIDQRVRAMQPWPTAFTFLHRTGKEPMRIIVNSVGKETVPSSVDRTLPLGAIHPDPQRLLVSCGIGSHNSLLEILELQPAGKKKMTAQEFLRGYPPSAGMRFAMDAAQ